MQFNEEMLDNVEWDIPFPREFYSQTIPMPVQPDPVKNGNPHITDLVIEDMKKRKEIGIMRYGVALQANNGRDALQDAYEEALDLCQYLKQAIEERNENR